MNIIKRWMQLEGWKKIIVGLLAGIVTGIVFKERAEVLQPIGTMFIHAIQMLVVPVVLTAIVCAVISLKNANTMGKMIVKALLVYGVTMAIAATLGIVIANAFNVGANFDIGQQLVETVAPQTLNLGDVLVNFIPTSPVQAFASNNVMQILCFALLLGLAIRSVGEKAKPVRDFFLSASEVVFAFARLVIGFAPYGVFALIACVIGKYGVAALLPLIKLIAAVYLACALLILVVYSGLLLLCRIHPKFFLGNITEALVTAFTTSSSAATLPVTMRCARENLKINSHISDFLLPLGTTLNLNGLAIYLSVATIFAANMFSITLSTPQYISLVITIVFTAAGAAAIPGSGMIVMSAVMTAMGIPLAAIPIIAGVDRFNDMAQTMTNVAGDLFATTVVAKSEGMMGGAVNTDVSAVAIDQS